MAAQMGGTLISPTTRSRLATLMGLSPSEPSKRSREEEWYIPYNGPVEPPHNDDDTFGRRQRGRATSNATRKSYASSQGTRSFYGGGGIGEAPVNSAVSTRDRTSTLGTRERAMTYDRLSTYSRDEEREKSKEQERRGSIGSFLTFGGSMRRKTNDMDPEFVFPKIQPQGRRSEESRMPARQKEDTRGYAYSDESTMSSSHFSHQAQHKYTPFHQHPQSQQPRVLPVGPTTEERERQSEKRRLVTARDSMEVSAVAPSGNAGTDGSRPPPNGFGELRREEVDEDVPNKEQGASVPEQEPTIEQSTSEQLLQNAVHPRHPYAVIFPSIVHDTRPQEPLRFPVPPSHEPALIQTTSLKRNITSPKPQQDTQPNVSPVAIAAALSRNTRSLLRKRPGTSSTPNLRGLAARDREKLVRAPSAKAASDRDKSKTQYAAETWCDALMFPRPRFRAHLVSPPASPPNELLEEPLNEQLEEDPILETDTSAWNPEQIMPDSFQQPSQNGHAEFQPVISMKRPLPVLAPTSPPAEEAIRRVLVQAEQRDREREMWSEVARTSFQNRRSRSLSRTRTRKKSGASGARARVESDAGRRNDGLSPRTIAVGLAAEAFRARTPTISVAISNTSTMHANEWLGMISRNASSSAQHGSGHGHTRNTSTSAPYGSSHGHTHNLSWSKVATKVRGQDGMEASPEEKLEGALRNERTARLNVRGRREEAAEADTQLLDIAPQALAATSDLHRGRQETASPFDRSQSQNSYASDSPGVGIAISTPPPQRSEQDLPDLSSHPYARPSAPRRRAEPVPVSAPYAGPHPTLDYAQSSREHPESRQAPVGWERIKGAGSPDAYAYANVTADNDRKSTLGVEEVLLSRTFQRGAEGGFGGMDKYKIDDEPPPMPIARAEAETEAEAEPEPEAVAEEKPETDVDGSLLEPTTPPSASTLSRIRRKPIELNAAFAESTTLLPHTTTPTKDSPPVRMHPREASTTLSSPTSQGSASGQASPRATDDLEPFRDLFYKPGRSGSDSYRRRSSEQLRRLMGSQHDSTGSWSEDRIKSSEGLNGLRALALQTRSRESTLGHQELEQDEDKRETAGDDMVGDGVQEVQLGPSISPLPGLNTDPLQLGSPLRAEYEDKQNFPEDIESSRASSVMDHDKSAEDTLRLGTVALAVAETTKTERRQSTSLTIGNTEEDGGSQAPNRDTVMTATSSLGIPGTAEDLARTSFATTSSTSHMSNLIGNFPAPPLMEGLTPPSAAALDPYFAPSDVGESRVQSHISNAVIE